MYLININKYSGLSWKIELVSTTYEELCHFVDDILKSQYKHITKQKFCHYNSYKNIINKKRY